MKKFIICLTASIIFILLIGGSILFLFRDSPKYGLLKVNEVDITQENVMLYFNYAELPITKLMESLGAKVDWVDNSIAEITYKEKAYTLNLATVSLIEVGQNFNLLLPPPGDNRVFKVLDKELVLDSNTIKSTLYQMGTKINVDINCKERIVYIFEIKH